MDPMDVLSMFSINRLDGEPVPDDMRILLPHHEELARRSGVIFRRAVELADSAPVREWAMTMLLAGSYVERVSDTAVDIAEQTVVVVNGLFREAAEADALPRAPAAAS